MEYLYYRLWQLLIGKSEEDMPPFGSMMIMWMLIVFNLRTMELIIYHFWGFGFTPKDKNEAILYSLIPSSIVLIFNIFYLFRRRNKIKLKYENESNLKKLVGNIILCVFAILTVVISFVIADAYPIYLGD